MQLEVPSDFFYEEKLRRKITTDSRSIEVQKSARSPLKKVQPSAIFFNGDTWKTKTVAKLLSDPVYTMVCKNTWNKYLPCIKDYFNYFKNNISLFSTYQVTVLEYLIQ